MPPNFCRWCHGAHELCPSVKAIEFHENGVVSRVEFKCADDYVQSSPQLVLFSDGDIQN